MKKLMLALAIVAAGSAAAQDQDPAAARGQDAAAAERLRGALQERALTRPREGAPPIGVKAQEVARSRVNWTAMQTELALTQRRELAAQQSVATGQTRAAGAAPGLRAASPESFKGVVVREVNVTRLPVIVPEGPRIAQTLKVWSLGDSYSATAEVEDGVSMRMSGSRKKIVVGDREGAAARIKSMRAGERMLPSLSVPYVVSRSESSTDLSFSKFGAGYVLSIMCDDPADLRCAEDAFIVSLASQLTLLNADAEGE